MKKFYNFAGNELRIDGTLATEKWFDDEVTPDMFRAELATVKGDLTVWLNSCGGDVIAGSQIYTMLKEHKGNVTVKIDGWCASAASVVAMAGSSVEISPTAYMLIHDPMCLAFGNKADFVEAITMLDEIKEGILNAYELKTSLPRAQIADLMANETTMSAKKAVELGFADTILYSLPETRNDDGKPINYRVLNQKYKFIF
jgi:ATP-dependent Clp protease protease subunit